MLPRLYQIHFQKYLKLSDYLFLEILINLTQSIKQVNLEKLATSLPLPILFESRRKKIQRFLSLLQQLGLKPGISFDLRGVKMTKTKQVAGFDLAAKWQKKRYGLSSEEGWFILTNLGSLESATTAYKKRFGIEEMFRDFKKGGYNERRN